MLSLKGLNYANYKFIPSSWLKVEILCAVCSCTCVFLYSTGKGRTFLGREDILAGPQKFKGQFEG